MDDSLPIRDRSPILRWLRGVPAPPRERRSRRSRARRPRDIVAATSLPFALGDTVMQVVSMVGGTRAEREGVTLELCAHFEDALAKGATPERALAEFGDPHLAARLLRRAVRRRRGSVWMTAWWASRAAVALLAVATLGYAWVAARYWLASPTIDVNYVARFQASFPQGPPSEVGWPLYRDALVALQDGRIDPLWRAAQQKGDAKGFAAFLSATSPEHPEWRLAGEFRAAHAGALDLLHRAAARDAIGFVPGKLALEDRVFFNTPVDFSPQPEPWRESLSSVLLPQLAPLRSAGLALIADARHALHDGDSARATTSLVACLRLAMQLRDPLFVSQVVSNGLASLAATTIATLVSEHGDAFSAHDLERLSVALGDARVATWSLDIQGWTWLVADIAQRSFSDNGNGDGSLLASVGGLAQGAFEQPQDTDSWTARALAPIATISAPTRREFLALATERLANLERQSLMPPWKRAGEPPPPSTKEWEVARRALPVVDLIFRTFEQLGYLQSFDTVRADLNAAEVAVAVRRFRDAHSRWPDGLEELVPSFLAAVPRDPWADAPIRYAVNQGRPTLWSVGPNGTDDGGVDPVQPPRPEFVVPDTGFATPGDLVWWRIAE